MILQYAYFTNSISIDEMILFGNLILQTQAFIFCQIKIVFRVYLIDHIHSTVCVSGCVTAGNPLLLVEPVPQKALAHRDSGFCYLLNPVGHDPTPQIFNICALHFQRLQSQAFATNLLSLIFFTSMVNCYTGHFFFYYC